MLVSHFGTAHEQPKKTSRNHTTRATYGQTARHVRGGGSLVNRRCEMVAGGLDAKHVTPGDEQASVSEEIHATTGNIWPWVAGVHVT